jgi:hypothetical protein
MNSHIKWSLLKHQPISILFAQEDSQQPGIRVGHINQALTYSSDYILVLIEYLAYHIMIRSVRGNTNSSHITLRGNSKINQSENQGSKLCCTA